MVEALHAREVLSLLASNDAAFFVLRGNQDRTLYCGRASQLAITKPGKNQFLS
jgi:hypothetical protein